jgi:hypothetical protein
MPSRPNRQAYVNTTGLLTDQPLLGVHRDSKNAPNKNIDPDKPGTHTGPVKRSSFVKMSNVATVENATPKPRQMIAKKYFTLVLRCCDIEPSHALSTKALAASKECRAQNGRRANIAP